MRNLTPWALLILLFLVGCVSSTEAEISATEVTTVTDTPSVSSISTLDPDHYFNEAGKFSLGLPKGWRVFGPLEASVNGMPSYDIYILGTEPEASGGPGNSKVVIANPAEWTPEQFVQSQCSTCPLHPLEEVTLGGKEAQRTQIGGGDVSIMVTWYFVENNGKLIAMTIHDPETLEPLEDILESIQFE